MIQNRWIYTESNHTHHILIKLFSLRFARYQRKNGILIWNIPPWIEKSLIRFYRLFLNKMWFLVQFFRVGYFKRIKSSIIYNFCIAIFLRLVDLCVISISYLEPLIFEILIDFTAILAVSMVSTASDFNTSIFSTICTNISKVF